MNKFITDSLLKRLIKSPKKHRTYVYDPDLPGFQAYVGRKDATFSLRYVDDNGKHKRQKLGKLSFMSVVEARELAKDFLRHLSAGHIKELNQREDTTIDELYAIYMSSIANTAAERTILQYKSAWRVHIAPAFSGTQGRKVDAMAVAKLYDSISKSTGHIVTSLLKSMYSYAYKAGIYKTAINPVKLVKKRKATRRDRVLDALELARLVNTCKIWEEMGNKQSDYAVFILIILTTGCRKGELGKVKKDDVCADTGRITLKHTKSGEERVVYTKPELVVKALRFARNRSNLFAAYTDTRISNRLFSDANISNCTVHDLRRTYISYAKQSGVALEDVAKIVGHSSTKTTYETYLHLSDAYKSRIGDDLAGKILNA